MPRDILSDEKIHPAIRDAIGTTHRDIVAEVKAAIEQHDVVVVGMKQNPFPKKVRALLKEHGIAFHYLEYGSYMGQWRPRLAIKMYTGWPTFPQVFVKGTLVGGFEDVKKLIEAGEFKVLLD